MLRMKKKELILDITKFKDKAYQAVSEKLSNWLDAQKMYQSCYDPTDDTVNYFNPTLFTDVLDRLLEQHKLADYTITVPQVDSDTAIQVIRDAIKQIIKSSGLLQTMRDDPKGALGMYIMGTTVLGWTATSKEERAKGVPIKFRSFRLSQAYFTVDALNIRNANGESDADECLLLGEMSKEEFENEFPKFKNIKPGYITSMNDDDDDLQTADTEELKDMDFYQVGLYYNVSKGIFSVIAGGDNEVLEYYSDKEKKYPNYPHKLNGVNYIPASILRAFTDLRSIYGFGVYDKFAKIARMDSRIRNMAYHFLENNIYPDRFVRTDPANYETFLNDLYETRELRKQGYESYIQLSPDSGVEIGDLRNAPLTQEFERAKGDIVEQVTQNGVAIRDVDRPASESATAVAAEEKAKSRLGAQVVTRNSSESIFIVNVIIDYIKRYLKKCDALVATNASIIEQAGDQAIEEPIKGVKFRDVAEFLNKFDVFVEEDLSEYQGIGLEFAKLMRALELVDNPASSTIIRKKATGLLGQKFSVNQLNPSNEAQPQQAQGSGVPKKQSRQVPGAGNQLPSEVLGGSMGQGVM